MRITFTQSWSSANHTYEKGQTYDVEDDIGRACVWRLKVATIATRGQAPAPLPPATPVPPPPPPPPPAAPVENN